jgi:drug/metabolite transporter (DMT)-like permease
MHLLLPLLASLLFVFGLILIKRARAAGAGPISVQFFTNQSAAIVFSFLWWFGGTIPSWTLLWQPAIVAALYMLGLALTYAAIERGDVSIAAPILGIKVVFVALLLTVFGLQELPSTVWYASILATAGIALIQWTGQGHPRRIAFTVLFALAAGLCYATFDVLVQRWAPAWGAGRFLPIVFWMLGIASLGLLPWVSWKDLQLQSLSRPLLSGSMLIALQSLFISLALAMFGDAARVNVVYSLRGLWGVLLAWAVARAWGGAEGEHPRRIMLTRVVGAAVLTLSVILAILAKE